MYRDNNDQLSAWFTSESVYNLGFEDISHLIDSKKPECHLSALIGKIRMRLNNIGGDNGTEDCRQHPQTA